MRYIFEEIFSIILAQIQLYEERHKKQYNFLQILGKVFLIEPFSHVIDVWGLLQAPGFSHNFPLSKAPLDALKTWLFVLDERNIWY